MYEAVTYDVVLNRMLGRVPETMDKRAGSVIWDTHSPTAAEFAILYIELDTLLNEVFGDTASREFLIRRCKERGLTPNTATKAILKGVFVPKALDVMGKRFNVDKLNFIVTEKIADGEYMLECETPGEEGHRHLGRMTPIEYIAGLESAVLTEVLIPGEDEEDTEHLRTRYFESFNDTAFGGNVKDYQNKVNAIAGVGAVKITRVWNADIRPADMIPSEVVQNWYTTATGSLSAEVKGWLTAVYIAAKEKKLTVGGTVRLTILDATYNAPTETLIQKVQTAIDPEQNAGEGIGLAPIGHVVNVVSAAVVKVNITTKITFSAAYSWDTSATAIKNAVEEYLLSLRKEWAANDVTVVRISQIENHIMAVTGVIDITGTTINGKEENLILGRDEIPVFGEVAKK